jgi:uncharacterized protein (TIGR02453 family)
MFSSAYLQFFQELSVNNTTEWFNANKKTYETAVKKPFEAFIDKLIADMRQLTPEINIEPKDAIFRINKDIRFSADKSPYKTEMSAVISKQGKKGNPCPGLYLNLGAEKVVVAAGLKFLEKEQLKEVRYYLADRMSDFAAIVHAEEFKSVFGEVQGDKIKRLPDEFKEYAEEQPLVYNTSFLAMVEMPAEDIVQTDFYNRVLKAYQVSLPFANFFKEPLSL